MKQPTLFDDARTTLQESIRLTVDSLQSYGPRYTHWAMAWSGGKDSTAALTVLLWLIETGQVQPPQSLTVLYADTRLELPPLAQAAKQMISRLRERVRIGQLLRQHAVGVRAPAVDVRIVLPAMDDRFLVYLLGRGVPPPNNNTLRWCTAQIKVEPMQRELQRLVGHLGQKVLMLTGVRVGESASRDARIQMSCSRNGSECGQGWYQTTLPESLCDTLAPMLHWRVCHVWDWLKFHAPRPKYGEWPTRMVADAYGGDEAEEINARTGCVGCPLANRDTALDAVLRLPEWSYLEPLKELRPLWRELREAKHRLRKPGGERRKDGTLTRNQNRMGPLSLESRLWAMGQVLDIQARCNEEAARLGREPVDILDAEEEARIRELIDAKTFPNKWTGEEPSAVDLYEAHTAGGEVQRLIFGG